MKYYFNKISIQYDFFNMIFFTNNDFWIKFCLKLVLKIKNIYKQAVNTYATTCYLIFNYLENIM